MKGKGYNHGGSNKGCKEGGSDGYAPAKPIGVKVHKPTADMSTPSFGQGCANGGKKK